MSNVAVYPGSPMSIDDVLEVGYNDVIVATGAQWRGDGIGRTLWRPVPGYETARIFTPDDLMAGQLPTGRVVVYDDDHYSMGGVLAEQKLQSLRVIGDAEAPNIIAQAVFAGHLAAREFDEAPVDGTLFRVERAALM